MHFVYTFQDIVALVLLILFVGGAILFALIALVVEFASKLWDKRWWK